MSSLVSLMRRPSLRRPFVWVAAGALFSQSACYSYRPAAPSALKASDDVRLVLSSEGSVALQPMLGPDVGRIAGAVQETIGDSSVVLLVDDVTTKAGATVAWRRGRVTVPIRAIAAIERRTLDRRRTRTFAVVATTAFVAVVVAAIKQASSSGSSRSGPGSGPPE
jgi:hypothetical protein